MSTPKSKPDESRSTSAFASQERIEPLEGEASEQPVSPVFAHVMLGCVLGVLFAVAITSPVRPKDDIAQNQQLTKQTIAQTSTPAAAVLPALPEVRDLGTFSSGTNSLIGHLTATWSDKLSYQLEIGPSDPALSDAFSYSVSTAPHAVPVSLDLRTSSGQEACNQEFTIGFKPVTGTHTATSEASSTVPESQSFQSVLGKDGKIGSISAQGAMPCTRQAFDSVAAWSFSLPFPDLREEAALLQHRAAERVVAKSSAPQAHPLVKAPEHHLLTASLQKPTPVQPSILQPVSTPAAAVTQPVVPQLAETTSAAPLPFQFAVEGDDEIVDVNASQRSIQTTAGKVFLVREQLAAADGDGVLDELANIHYRCDQSASCTLSLSDATVLHATLRLHHSTSQPTELSMSDSQTSILAMADSSSQAATDSVVHSSPIAVGLEAFGR